MLLKCCVAKRGDVLVDSWFVGDIVSGMFGKATIDKKEKGASEVLSELCLMST